MTDTTTLKPFKREERYIVVKIKDHNPDSILQLRDRLDELAIGTTECVVVESDWHPEYERVWAMIEARCNGTRPSQSGVTQADRELFIELMGAPDDDPKAHAEVRNGGWDNNIVMQKLVAHRQPYIDALPNDAIILLQSMNRDYGLYTKYAAEDLGIDESRVRELHRAFKAFGWAGLTQAFNEDDNLVRSSVYTLTKRGEQLRDTINELIGEE